MIVPQGHHKNHSSFQSFVNGVHATLLQEIGAILRLCNPILAEFCCDTVMLVTIHSVHRMFNGLTILMVNLLHLNELARVSVVLCDELCCDLNRLGGVNLEVGTRTKKVLHTKTIGLHVTTILVADALESLTGCIIAAISSFASGLAATFARVHGEGRAVLVGLPNIDLRAAAPELAGSSIWVGVAWLPTFHIGLTIDELEIMRALSITITHAIFGTSISILGLATISIHLHKIQSTIEATIQFGIIHGVGELLVLQLEEHVRVIGIHEIRPRSHILAVRAIGHKAKGKRISRTLNAICAGVLGICSFNDAIGCARGGIRAESCIPTVSSVAIVESTSNVCPSPIRINGYLTLLRLATGPIALGERQ